MTYDPELDEVFDDPELRRIARVLSSAQSPEPPLDDAFRGNLRRRLMDQAWDSVEDRRAWWRGLFAPQRLAWVGAAAVVVLVASVVLYTATQPPLGNTQEIRIGTSLPPEQVATRQAIPVTFNQPMDHASTQAAVQITPATTVSYSWSGDRLLYLAPTSGDLAPNTQYQVTIGAGARTQAGAQLTTPQTVTFTTTAPNASPAASPSPTATPSSTSLLTGVLELTGDYSTSGAPVVWSNDSATIYFVGPSGALESISAKGGDVKKLVSDGVAQPAIAPAGDRLAFVRNGKLVILELSAGTTTEVADASAQTVLRWVKDQLYWADATGVFRLEASGPSKVLDNPVTGGAPISIAPDGRHAIFQLTDGLVIVDLASGKPTPVCGGGCTTAFQGWSPDGSRFIYNGNIADTNGKTVSSIPPGDASWSANNEILLGSDTALFEVRPDGNDYVKLADGTFHLPVWAPDATTFTFVRGSKLEVATAPAPKPQPPAVDQALRVVNQFMQARVEGHSDRALSFLDDAGKAAYAGQSPALIPQGDPSFKRFYVVTSEVDPSNNSVRVVVRLVFRHGKVEQTSLEEMLSLVRAEATDPYVIHSASVGAQLQFGKGPQVVAVTITPTTLAVTFDSDLQAPSITNVTLQDDQGQPVLGTVNYEDRTVTFTNLQLTPGAHYRLVVLPGIQDVANHNAAAEYDLELVGPAPDTTSGGGAGTPPPSPSPAVSPTPSPTASPS